MAFIAKEVQKPARNLYVADINNDSQIEVIYSTYSGDIICQDESTGTVNWTYSVGSIVFHLTAFDIDDDGNLCIFAASANGKVYAINSDGTERWVYTTSHGYPLYQVGVGRFKNGLVRIVAGGSAQNLYILRDNGDGNSPTLRGTFSIGPIIAYRYIRQMQCVDTGSSSGGDFGEDQILIGISTGRIAAYAVDTGGLSDSLTFSWLKDIVDVYWPQKYTRYGYLPYYGNVTLSATDSFSNAGWRLVARSYPSASFVTPAIDGATINGSPVDTKIFAAYTGRVGMSDSTMGNDIIVVSGTDISIYWVDGTTGEISELESATNSSNESSQTTIYNDAFLYESPDGSAGVDTIYLSSAPCSNDNRIYKLTFDDDWVSDVENYVSEGKLSTINDYIDNLLEVVSSKDPVQRINNNTFNFLTVAGSVGTGTLSAMKAACLSLSGGNNNPTISEFGSSPFIFSWSVEMSETGHGSTWGEGVEWDSSGQVSGPSSSPTPQSSANLIELATYCESLQQPYWIILGNSRSANISHATLESMIQASPTYLLGFRFSENGNVDQAGALAYYLYYIKPVLDLCVTYNKKSTSLEKRLFWAQIPAMSDFSFLVDGTYKEVFIPAIEESNTTSSPVNFAARIGLGIGNIFSNLAERAIEDMWRWNDVIDHGPLVAHHFYRLFLRAAVCGINNFDIKAFWRDSGIQDYSFLGEKSIRLFCKIIEKGLLSIPSFSQLRNISPVKITMTEPDSVFINETTQSEIGNILGFTQNSDAVLGRYATWWAGMNTPTYNIGNYLYGQQKLVTYPIPVTKYGLPVIIPQISPQPSTELSFNREVRIDGKNITYLSTFGATAGKSLVESLFVNEVSNLPFSQDPDDNIFMMCYITSSTAESDIYDMFICDAEWNDSVDQTITITVNQTRTGFNVTDKLFGSNITKNNSSFTIDIPSAGIAILKITIIKSSSNILVSQPDRTVSPLSKIQYTSIRAVNIDTTVPDHIETHYQIFEKHMPISAQPQISIKSSSQIRTNGNVVSINKNELNIILKENTAYKIRMRFRGQSSGWGSWTEVTEFRTRNKDYKYYRPNSSN